MSVWGGVGGALWSLGGFHSAYQNTLPPRDSTPVIIFRDNRKQLL